MLMLVSWEVWEERNAKVFRNNASPSTFIIAKIKEEAKMLSIAGAKFVCNAIRRE
jgi:hypothetical protein